MKNQNLNKDKDKDNGAAKIKTKANTKTMTSPPPGCARIMTREMVITKSMTKTRIRTMKRT